MEQTLSKFGLAALNSVPFGHRPLLTAQSLGGSHGHWAPFTCPPARGAAATDAGSTRPYVSAILAGVVEPDFNRVVSHKIPNLALRGTLPPPRSGAANELKRLPTYAQEMVRLRRVDEAPYAEMLRLGQDLDEVLFVLGQATHFVEDLNQPFHAAWGETRAGHNEIETHGLSVRSSKASAYVASSSSRTTPASGSRRGMHGRSSLTVRLGESRVAWDQAVNDTANLWQSIFWHALRPERAGQLYGITQPVKAASNGSRC